MNEQRTIEKILDNLDEVLEDTWALPLSGGKRVVDIEDIRAFADEIRMNLPIEIRKAKAIVADRAQILSEAQREAETIVRVAEDKAKTLVNQEEIVRQAQAKANDIMAQSQAKFREMRNASNAYVDDLMRRSDDALATALAELRKTRQSIQAAQQNHQQ